MYHNEKGIATSIVIADITKHNGDKERVNRVGLEIKSGFTMLGIGLACVGVYLLKYKG